MSKQMTKKAYTEVRELVTRYHTEKGAEKKATMAKVEKLVEGYEFDLKALVKALKPRSRRSLIIELVQEGIWDNGTLSEALTFMGYPDTSANSKAVSGTLYDMKANKGWVVRDERTSGDVVNKGIFVEIPAE